MSGAHAPTVRNRPRATRVRTSASIRANPQTARTSISGAVPLIVMSLFVLIVIAGTLAGRLSPFISVIYGVVSTLTYLLYWFDKSAARRGDHRTPESSLLLMGLVGGWPGAVVAQRMLRHKTRKLSFQLAFWGTAVMNSIGLVWLLTRSGLGLTKRLLE